MNLKGWLHDWGLILAVAFIALVIAVWPRKKEKKPEPRVERESVNPVVHIHNHGTRIKEAKKEEAKKEEAKKEEPKKEEPKKEEEKKEEAKEDDKEST